jgi:hypothetical protein
VQASGVGVNPQVDTTYNEIKLGHKHGFVIYNLNEAMTEIVVQETAPPSATYAEFLAKMPKVWLNWVCWCGVFVETLLACHSGCLLDLIDDLLICWKKVFICF